MSKPSKPSKALLFSSIIYNVQVNLDGVIARVVETFGPIDYKSCELNFDKTDYYADEMGGNLKRVFVSFGNLVERDQLAKIKLETNLIEQSFLKGNSRAVNIDPGLITLENVVLATGKNYSHRIYLTEGIFAEVTLLFKAGSYTSLEWTYPDYASREAIEIFNQMREKYKKLSRC